MRNKIFWFLAAVLVSSSANADPCRYRAQPERGRAWVIEGNELFLEEARKPRRAQKVASEPYLQSGSCPDALAFKGGAR